MADPAADPVGVYERRRRLLVQAIKELEDATPTVMYLGTSYTAAEIPTLDSMYRVLKLQAAIEQVELRQSYAVDGVTYTRANLRDLRQALKDEEATQARVTRGGIKVWEGVPR